MSERFYRFATIGGYPVMIRNLSPSQDYLSLIEKYQTAYTCFSTVQSKIKKAPLLELTGEFAKQ